MHIAIVAGEASGDQLGAELIQSLRRLYPDSQFDGVGGALMQAQGFRSLLPIEDFSVMGITEIVKSLPRLLRYRKILHMHYRQFVPDVFIAIDYPEFNLSLENRLKAAGICTVHYVSPSVWAWREERIHHIKKSCDLMLTLFDFEAQFYHQHDMPVAYCGHPLVDRIPENASAAVARQQLGLTLTARQQLLAVLPGSREGEVNKMLPIFLQVMQQLVKHLPDCRFIIPAATPQLKTLIEQQIASACRALAITVVLRQGKEAMQAADAVLMTSGTATLEAMLLERPMLVSYKVSGLTAHLAKKRLKVKYFSLPNLLANDAIVPEFMQEAIDPEKMALALRELLTAGEHRQTMVARFRALRGNMKTQAADNAAKAIYQHVHQARIASGENV